MANDVTVQPTLEGSEDVFRSADRVLSLGDNWDDEDSPGYSSGTLDRAKRFARHFLATGAIPEILPGPQGSLDIRWKNGALELLANVPADPSLPASYYGDDGDGRSAIRGACDPWQADSELKRWLSGV